VFQVAVPDLVEAATGADIIIFVSPHQFIRRQCGVLKGKIKPTAIAVSLIKVSLINYFALFIEFWINVLFTIKSVTLNIGLML